MNKNNEKKIIEVAEKLDWTVRIDGNEFTFSKFSPSGQDFNIEITAEDLDEVVEQITERYDDFDASSETYLWLDSEGHGTNGAPYDMKDLYEDMEACEEMIKELYEALEEIEEDEEEETEEEE